MKRIVAVVKPNMLDDVIFALHKIEDFPGATMSEVRGMGRGFRKYVQEKQREASLGYPVQVRIEIVCRDEKVEEIVAVIEQNARTGRRGDGKVFVSAVEDALRISTGERGMAAI